MSKAESASNAEIIKAHRDGHRKMAAGEARVRGQELPDPELEECRHDVVLDASGRIVVFFDPAAEATASVHPALKPEGHIGDHHLRQHFPGGKIAKIADLS